MKIQHLILTVIAAVVPWSVYLSFVAFPCVIVSGKRGAGWCLAVVYFVMSLLAFLFMVLTVCMEIRPRLSLRKKAAPPTPLLDGCGLLMADPCCGGGGMAPMAADQCFMPASPMMGSTAMAPCLGGTMTAMGPAGTF